MGIVDLLQLGITVFALLAGIIALRRGRNDDTYKLAQGWKEAYGRENKARQEAEADCKEAEASEKAAWDALDKAKLAWSAERNALLELIAEERVASGKLRENKARKRLDAQNGDGP